MAGGSSTSNEVRYAPYLETEHGHLLVASRTYREQIFTTTPITYTAEFMTNNPWYGFSTADPSGWFFSSGTYAGYSSLFDLFEDNMEANISTLYNTIVSELTGSTYISDMLSAFATDLEDEIQNVALPELRAGYRDANSVMSTGFINAQVQLYNKKQLMLTKYLAEIQHKAMDQALQKWISTLEWRKNIVTTYGLLNELYWKTYWQYIDIATSIKKEMILWPLHVNQVMQSIIQINLAASTKGPSQVASALGGAVMGAAAGAQVGTAIGPAGTGVGAGIGFLMGGLAGLLR